VVANRGSLGGDRGEAEHGNDLVREATGREDRHGGSDRRTELYDARDRPLATRDRGRIVEHDEPQGGGEAGVVGVLRAGRARPPW
jgi:hypothetical protein